MSLLAPQYHVYLAASRLIHSNGSIQQWADTALYNGAMRDVTLPRLRASSSVSVSFLHITTYSSVVRLGILEGRGRHVAQFPRE